MMTATIERVEPLQDLDVLPDDEHELARAVLMLLGGPNWVVSDGGLVHIYNHATGVWEHTPPRDLQTQVIATLVGQSVSSNGAAPRRLNLSMKKVRSVAEMMGVLPLACYPGYFDNPEHTGMHFNNCYLTIDPKLGTAEHRFSPLFKSRGMLAIDYNADATCPHWEKFLGDVLGSDDDGERKQLLLAEFIGACLAGTVTRFAKCLWITGTGNNGKSTMLEVIEGLFTTASVSAIAPHDWGNQSKYYLYGLVGRKINLVTEASDTRLTNTEVYKAVISGDPVTARLPYSDPVRFRPQAGHLLSCNELPATADQSAGFWRRALVLRMDNDFTGREQNQAELVKRLKKELAGIANWAVQGVMQLHANNGYTIPQSSTDAREDWRMGSDEVLCWMHDNCTEICPANEHTLVETLYMDYKTWCIENGHKPASSMKFSRRLVAMKIRRYRDTADRYRSSYGLILRSRLYRTAGPLPS